MARARLLKPGFFTNEQLHTLHPYARLLFAGLWTIADREGRLEDRPTRIKVEIFPYDNVKIVGLLDALEAAGFIVRFESGGTKFIQILNFLKHQSPHVREPASTIPAPGQHEASTGPAPVRALAQHDPGPAVAVAVIDPVAETVAVPDASAPEDDLPPDVREIRDTVMSKLPSKFSRDDGVWDEALSFAKDYAGQHEELARAIAEVRRQPNMLPFPGNLRRYMPEVAGQIEPRSSRNGSSRIHPDADENYVRDVEAMLKRRAGG